MTEIRTDTDRSQLTILEETLSNDHSRKTFLATLMGGAAAATALAVAPTATTFAGSRMLKHAGAGLPKGDADILNFALTLEHLETAFYAQAVMSFKGNNYMARLVKIIHGDEAAHVGGLTAAIKGAGYTPVAAAPSYKFPKVWSNAKAFATFAATLEDVGVHAYLGAAPSIKTPSVLLTAASIVTVEARHTGAFRALLQKDPTDGAFDKGMSKAQILKIAGPLIGK
jgi:rubrerythrin